MTLTSPGMLRWHCPACGHARGWHDKSGCAKGECDCKTPATDIGLRPIR